VRRIEHGGLDAEADATLVDEAVAVVVEAVAAELRAARGVPAGGAELPRAGTTAVV
jgi:hypothetical protein